MRPAKELFKQSVEIFGKHFWQMLSVVLVPYLLSLLMVLIGDRQPASVLLYIGTTVIVISYFIGQFALLHAAHQVNEGSFSLAGAYKLAIKKIFSLIWINWINISVIFSVMILAVLVLGLGRVLGNFIGNSEFLNIFLGVLFLLISLSVVVLGAILSLRLSFSSWFLVTDRLRGMAAGAESLVITKGKVWMVLKKMFYLLLWYLIFYIPLTMLAAFMPNVFYNLLSGVLSILFAPISAIYIYLVFKELVASGSEAAEINYAKWLKISVWAFTLVLIVGVILAVLFRDQLRDFLVLNQMLKQ